MIEGTTDSIALPFEENQSLVLEIVVASIAPFFVFQLESGASLM